MQKKSKLTENNVIATSDFNVFLFLATLKYSQALGTLVGSGDATSLKNFFMRFSAVNVLTTTLYPTKNRTGSLKNKNLRVFSILGLSTRADPVQINLSHNLSFWKRFFDAKLVQAVKFNFIFIFCSVSAQKLEKITSCAIKSAW